MASRHDAASLLRDGGIVEGCLFEHFVCAVLCCEDFHVRFRLSRAVVHVFVLVRPHGQ